MKVGLILVINGIIAVIGFFCNTHLSIKATEHRKTYKPRKKPLLQLRLKHHPGYYTPGCGAVNSYASGLIKNVFKGKKINKT